MAQTRSLLKLYISDRASAIQIVEQNAHRLSEIKKDLFARDVEGNTIFHLVLRSGDTLFLEKVLECISLANLEGEAYAEFVELILHRNIHNFSALDMGAMYDNLRAVTRFFDIIPTKCIPDTLVPGIHQSSYAWDSADSKIRYHKCFTFHCVRSGPCTVCNNEYNPPVLFALKNGDTPTSRFLLDKTVSVIVYESDVLSAHDELKIMEQTRGLSCIVSRLLTAALESRDTRIVELVLEDTCSTMEKLRRSVILSCDFVCKSEHSGGESRQNCDTCAWINGFSRNSIRKRTLSDMSNSILRWYSKPKREDHFRFETARALLRVLKNSCSTPRARKTIGCAILKYIHVPRSSKSHDDDDMCLVWTKMIVGWDFDNTFSTRSAPSTRRICKIIFQELYVSQQYFRLETFKLLLAVAKFYGVDLNGTGERSKVEHRCSPLLLCVIDTAVTLSPSPLVTEKRIRMTPRGAKRNELGRTVNKEVCTLLMMNGADPHVVYNASDVIKATTVITKEASAMILLDDICEADSKRGSGRGCAKECPVCVVDHIIRYFHKSVTLFDIISNHLSQIDIVSALSSFEEKNYNWRE